MNPSSRKVRTLDVRPLIAQGEEPFQEIMATLASLGPAEDFVVISPFLPSPLIEKLQSEGFTAKPVRHGDGSWRTHFSRP
ncbi:MAG TPA: DUF2249 domain-containing protein [Opitutaceae bacterium]|nr:DUF2249 domain-containing protein [Opitutaceae bacterium]